MSSPATASFQTASVPLSSIPAPFTRISIPDDANHEAIALQAVERLAELNEESLSSDSQWRDIVALTGNMRTFFGHHNITRNWTKLAALERPTRFSLTPQSSSIVRRGPNAWVQATFTFLLPSRARYPRRSCSGIMRLAPGPDSGWKIVLLVTLLEQIDGCGNVDVLDKRTPQQSAKEQAAAAVNSGQNSFDCVVVGGGPAGLATAGRLKALGISHVVLDRNDKIGGSWLTRYPSLTLHTSKYHSEMPLGGVFSHEDPYFLSSAHLVAGYQRFVDWYGLSVWCSTALNVATWHGDTRHWTLELGHNLLNVPPKRYLKTRHLVFAMGSGGQVPKIPTIANRALYGGEILHSVNYTSAEQWKGKRGVIIGSGNSAHDIAIDMAKAGLKSVTVLQRSPTTVLPLSTYKAIVDSDYHQDADVDLADRLTQSIPLNVARVGAIDAIRQLSDSTPEYWDKFEQAGFAVDRYPDLVHVIYERQGGHYYDVGGSEKIISGEVAVEQGVSQRFTENGLQLESGRVIDADVVVFATGFEHNMRNAAMRIVDPETAPRLEEYMMVDKEGEPRGYVKPMYGQPNAWYIGGGIPMSRYYSRFLALQIKADLEGAPFIPYRSD